MNIFLIVMCLGSCQNATTSNNAEQQIVTSKSLNLQLFFTNSDAEKILGEAAHLKDSSNRENENETQYNCSYLADISDPETGVTGSLYVMIEHYHVRDSAQKVYAYIKFANQNHEGVEVVQDLGDEAYFHSDGEKFLFILARKGNYMLRMKVNKITSHTNRQQFDAVAMGIVGQW